MLIIRKRKASDGIEVKGKRMLLLLYVGCQLASIASYKPQPLLTYQAKARMSRTQKERYSLYKPIQQPLHNWKSCRYWLLATRKIQPTMYSVQKVNHIEE